MISLARYAMLFALVCLAGCRNHSERKSAVPGPATGNDDTLLVFRYGASEYPLHTSKYYATRLQGFQGFLDSSRSKDLTFSKFVLMDVTGDGRPDSCVARIYTGQNSAFVEHSVFSNRKMVFRDTLTIPPDAGCALFWEEDSSYYALQPYSTAYVARTFFSDFVLDSVDTASESFKSLAPVVYQILGNGREQEYWHRYLAAFRGRLIETLDLTDPGQMIWDARHQKFILYYAP